MKLIINKQIPDKAMKKTLMRSLTFRKKIPKNYY